MRLGGPAQGANKTASTTPQENKSQIPLPIKRAIQRKKEAPQENNYDWEERESNPSRTAKTKGARKKKGGRHRPKDNAKNPIKKPKNPYDITPGNIVLRKRYTVPKTRSWKTKTPSRKEKGQGRLKSFL